MGNISYLLTGGFLRGYRTLVLALALLVNVIAQYLVGDLTLIEAFKAHWAEIAGALGLITAAAHKAD